MTATTAPSLSPAGDPPFAIRAPEGGAGVATTVLATAKRTVVQFLRTPQLVVVSSIQGAMFLLIFRYVFGGAIDAGSVPYVDFLVPGFVVTGVLFTGMGAAAGVADDVEKGFFDRLRSLPVSRTALLGGRALADTALVTWGLVITIAIGFLIGFRIHGTAGEALAAFGLCVLYGFAFTWMFICIGLLAGSAQAAQGMSMLVFPLTFVSSAYVPVATMPSWMQPIAEHQPITAMSNAVRSLTLGSPELAGLSGTTSSYVVTSLLWCVGLVAVFAPIAVARYRKG